MNWLIRYITKLSSLEDKINLLKQKYNLSKNIISQLTTLDPTPNKSYLE